MSLYGSRGIKSNFEGFPNFFAINNEKRKFFLTPCVVLMQYRDGDPDWDNSDAYRQSNWRVFENVDVKPHSRMPDAQAELQIDYRKQECSLLRFGKLLFL